MGCSASSAFVPTPRPPLEKGNSLHPNGSSWSTRKTDRETIIGDPVHSSPGKHYSKFIAYILRAGIMNKPGVPLYLNLFASFELSGNDLVIEEHSNWDRKLPGTIVHSVLISNTLYENARADSNFRTALFDSILRYLVMIHPGVLIDDRNLAIIKIAKEYAGEDESHLTWFPKTIKPIDISKLL